MRSRNPSQTRGIRSTIVLLSALVALIAGTGTVTVNDGDTLHSISHDVGVPMGELMRLNGLANPNSIAIGMQLKTGRSHQEPAHEGRHVVAPGETVAQIAEAHGVPVETLVGANGIVKGRILAGVALRLEAANDPFEPQAGGSHTVGAGETLAEIALHHGTTVARLVEENHIHDVEDIGAGMTLRMPGWQCPVGGGTFVNDWSIVKPSGRIHEGVDVFAPRGTQILAPVSGTAVQNEGKIGGLTFTLVGNDGVVYYGAHMDSPGRSGLIKAGEVLGRVGSSGNAAGTSPHLHFEVHPGGGADVNPYPALVAGCG